MQAAQSSEATVTRRHVSVLVDVDDLDVIDAAATCLGVPRSELVGRALAELAEEWRDQPPVEALLAAREASRQRRRAPRLRLVR
jgi:hypothetical protein